MLYLSLHKKCSVLRVAPLRLGVSYTTQYVNASAILKCCVFSTFFQEE